MNNALLKLMPKLIQELVEKQFPINIDLAQGTIHLQYFYKYKELVLEIKDDKIIGVIKNYDKNDLNQEINTIDDIVRLNFECWIASNTKKVQQEIQPIWQNEFLKRKWLNKVYIYTPNFEEFENFKLKEKENSEEQNVSLADALSMDETNDDMVNELNFG